MTDKNLNLGTGLSEEEIQELQDEAELESWKVDKYVSTIKENNEEIDKYKEILKKRKEELDLLFKQKEESLKKQNHFLLTTLNTFAKSQKDLKSTKTQFKYPSLSGDIVIKKSQSKLKKPESKEVLEKIEKSYPDLIVKETTRKLNWKDLKSKLIVQDGTIYDKETGENVDELVTYEVTEEETKIQ